MSHQDSPSSPAESTSRWASLLTLVTTSRIRWAVVAFWIVVVAFTAPVASRIGEVESNGNRSQLPASSESLEADLRLDEFDEGLADELRDRLAALERAEQRLAAGTYGLSVETGKPIPDERLEALPTAERTVEEERALGGRGS